MLRRVLDRESVVKSNLIKRLIECVKELQFKYAADKGAPLVNDEATNLLCWILEAVFIHGLKNPFLKSVTSVFNSRENVEPSFWEFVLIFCHQEVIVQINKLSLISTDVGRCRSWLRLALNDGLFLSYFTMMLKDKTTVKEYYKPGAFLRDSESCDLLKNYLYGVESYDFQLASNSSLLNQWNSGPLSLVGLWTSSDPADSISQGVDVAENMDSHDLQVLPAMQTGRNSRYQRLPSFVQPIRAPLLDEDQAIRVILSSKPGYPSSSPVSSRMSSADSTPPKEVLFTPPERKVGMNSNAKSSNLKNKQVTDSQVPSKTTSSSTAVTSTTTPEQNTPREIPRESTGIREDISGSPTLNQESRKPTSRELHAFEESQRQSSNDTSPENAQTNCDINEKDSDINRQDKEKDSYSDLLNTYNQHHPVGTPITESYLDSIFPRSLTALSGVGSSEENRSPTPTSLVEPLGFEVLSIISSSGHYSDMMPQVNSYLQRIPKEVGMDSQNYRCKNCDKMIGMIYGPAKLCALSGHYFCQECHINDESVIPARILLNWDFNRYSVSKQAKIFLEDILEQPIFDLEKINHRIYNEVEELDEVRIQREKIQSIALYLQTCKEPCLNDATKDIWPKEHLTEDVHLYSLADLLSVPNRNLASALLKLVNFGKSHIFSCNVCQQKGFVCEICKDVKVIFPFEFETNYKCFTCGAVYHNYCMNSKKPCPRCQRRSQRRAANEDFLEID